LEQLPAWAGLASRYFRWESVMADDKSKIGKQDQGRLACGDHYEIRDFAWEFGISLGQVRDLIRRHGNDRATLESEARKLKGSDYARQQPEGGHREGNLQGIG
jgi:hypothetical protein